VSDTTFWVGWVIAALLVVALSFMEGERDDSRPTGGIIEPDPEYVKFSINGFGEFLGYVQQMKASEREAGRREGLEQVITFVESQTGPKWYELIHRKTLVAAIRALLPKEAQPAPQPTPKIGDTLCQVCGMPNPGWYTETRYWNLVIPERVGILCLRCFAERALSLGITGAWILSPDLETNSLVLGATPIQRRLRAESAEAPAQPTQATCSGVTAHEAHTFGGRPMQYCPGVKCPWCGSAAKFDWKKSSEHLCRNRGHFTGEFEAAASPSAEPEKPGETGQP
jgi:hypothetical protein